MKKSQLIEEISKPLMKKSVTLLASRSDIQVPDLISLSLLRANQPAFRAAWILEYVVTYRPGDFETHVPQFLEACYQQNNSSCRRHFSKIIMHLTSPGTGRILLDPDRLLETVFEWMIDPATDVAVRVNCLDVLYNMRKCSDWVADELSAQIQFLLKDGSAALQSRGQRILRKLSGFNR